MNDLLILLASFGFGVLAWTMLVVSDWLLRDSEPSSASRGKSTAVRHHSQPLDLAYHH